MFAYRFINAACFVVACTGRMLVGLVREFLDWCNLEFTLKVFEPEIGRVAKFSDRGSLLRQLVSKSSWHPPEST